MSSLPFRRLPALMRRLPLLWLSLLLAGLFAAPLSRAAGGPPVRIGLTAEFGIPGSTSAQAVEMGIRLAISEINARGGVLKGRPLELVTRDDRSVPARAQSHLRELAAMEDLVAVFTAKFSPVVLEIKPLAEELQVPLLATWSAADPIIDPAQRGSFVFRLSLRDTWAIDTMMDYLVRQRGATHVGILLPNTGWGRSSLAAARAHLEKHRGYRLAAQWYNWGDKSLSTPYRALREEGANALLLVANEIEGAILVREMAALPAAERLPIAAHWGITGGNFVALAADALDQLDLAVVQTFTFNDPLEGRRRQVAEAALAEFGFASTAQIPSHVGFAHAYDLTHILARAIDEAGSTRRDAVRRGLENVKNVKGLVRDYAAPFTATRHEALGPEQIFLARFRKDGSLERLRPKR